MCDYCTSQRKLNVYSDDGLHAEINNDYIPRLVMYAIIDTDSGHRYGIEGCIDIKYCPICGRKLEDTENV